MANEFLQTILDMETYVYRMNQSTSETEWLAAVNDYLAAYKVYLSHFLGDGCMDTEPYDCIIRDTKKGYISKGISLEIPIAYTDEKHTTELLNSSIPQIKEQALSEIVENYKEMALLMKESFYMVKDFSKDFCERKSAATTIAILLRLFLLDDKLSSLTELYRNKTKDNILGFEARAVCEFIKAFCTEYAI